MLNLSKGLEVGVACAMIWFWVCEDEREGMGMLTEADDGVGESTIGEERNFEEDKGRERGAEGKGQNVEWEDWEGFEEDSGGEGVEEMVKKFWGIKVWAEGESNFVESVWEGIESEEEQMGSRERMGWVFRELDDVQLETELGENDREDDCEEQMEEELSEEEKEALAEEQEEER